MTTNGVLELPAADYHADAIGEQPTLSASIATLLITKSPAHARAAHPKLNPDYQRKAEERFDVGNVCHALLLEQRDLVCVVDAPDWRTKSAREEREEAREQGLIPLLRDQAAEVREMLAAAWVKLDAHHAVPPLFTKGQPERTLVWEENGVTCRALLDWLHDDRKAVDDYKTTSRSANPDVYAKNLYGVGGDVQASFYLRGCRANGFDPEWRWFVQETSAPYESSVIAPSPGMLEIGNAKVEWAIAKWKSCLESGEWLGYPLDVCYADLPAWEESRWLEKEAREAA